MSSPLMLPIKTLMPIPEDDKMPKYKYFMQFDSVVYYQPYHAVMDLILPYWCNKDEYSGEEVANLLKQVYNHLLPCIAALKHKALIDSRIGMAICNWVMCIHDALPRLFHISDWHHTIARMVPEVHPSHVLTHLLPNAPFPGEDGFNMNDPLTPLESYLLQCAVPEGALLRPGLVTNNEDFPGHVFNRFPTPLPDTAEDKEVIVFKSPPKKKSLSTPVHPQVTLSATPALPVPPPRSTHPQRTPISLVPPVANLTGVSPSPCNFARIHSLGTVFSSPVSPPSLLSDCQAPPLWSSFSPIKPLSVYRHPTGMTPITPSQHATLALQSISLSCSLQDMASSIQDLRQVLLTPGSGVGLHISGSAGATASATNNVTTPHSRAMPLDQSNPLLQYHLAPPLPPVSEQGDFAGIRPLLPVREEPAAPITPPPPLPEEEQSSTIVEELSPSVKFMDVDAPPSPPRVYHLVTDISFQLCNKIQQCEKRKKKKVKGKGKAVALNPEPSPPSVVTTSTDVTTSPTHEEPPSPPKQVLKRKHTPTKTAPSEPGLSKPTHASIAASKAAVIPSDAEASNAACLAVKKPQFSPKKASKKKSSCKTAKSAISDTLQGSNRMFLGHPKQQSLAAELTQAQGHDQEGIPIDRHSSCTELENYRFKDLVTVPNKFFDPIRYSHKNGTYGAHSLHYTYYVCASDHYEKTCLPYMHHQADCTWNNWFPGADCNQCQEGCHRGCSACYTTCEMHKITSHLTTFAQYNIPALCCNILQLCGINRELEHIDYLYCGHLLARNCVVHNIAESLDQFMSAESGNELIKDLSHVYREVCSFIVDDGLRHSLSLSLDLPEGPEYVPSDNDTSMWDESEDESTTGPSGVQDVAFSPQDLFKYLEAHKDKLIKDKEFKEIIFKAHSTIEKKFHINTLKQSIHKVLKTITGWVQSEQHVVKSGPPVSAPTGPCHNTLVTCSKGKARILKKSPAIIDSGSESAGGKPDKIPQMSLFHMLTDGILKMSVDDDNSKPVPPKAAKPFKVKSGDAVISEKCKESSKVDILAFLKISPTLKAPCFRISPLLVFIVEGMTILFWIAPLLAL
ncbi:hypothetical protein ARMGADRAFT_1071039 [Armillaria gallica]|uniref:Uncharacterized protein n=1 Tax=Armillaria gallica TaxID=47427 RepID=A0A2H3EB09_ARMGA|nr:hypothetical protein ARMGADRAFT_1071039 [Armillaria gallica]